jgi:hypothetical protein
MKVGLWVPKILGETKVDDIDLIPTFSDSHEEIVGLDVSMDEVARVNVFNARDLTDQSENINENAQKILTS